MSTAKNIPASIRQQLLNRSRKDNRPFNEILQYYVMERFLYRLSMSRYKNKFILKGALLMRVWQSAEFRPTMDIDMLCKTSNHESNIKNIILELLSLPLDDADGVVFDLNNIKTEKIKEDTDYEGIRIRFKAYIDKAQINMQLDIAFGDVIYPGPVKSELPTLLELPAPKLLCYSPESVIAEKFEAMIKLGMLNSRMKDFYDVWMLSRQFDFKKYNLAESINRTFKQRGTTLRKNITAFSEEFYIEKQQQWQAFRSKSQQDHIPILFSEIVLGIKKFLTPAIDNLLKEGIN